MTIKNSFFGPSVTVTGLLTGRDILQALKGKRLGDLLFMPSNTLKEDEAVFLDGMSIEELGQKLKVDSLLLTVSEMSSMCFGKKETVINDFRKNEDIRHIWLSSGTYFFSGNA